MFAVDLDASLIGMTFLQAMDRSWMVAQKAESKENREQQNQGQVLYGAAIRTAKRVNQAKSKAYVGRRRQADLQAGRAVQQVTLPFLKQGWQRIMTMV
jgi:hypothetical protein